MSAAEEIQNLQNLCRRHERLRENVGRLLEYLERESLQVHFLNELGGECRLPREKVDALSTETWGDLKLHLVSDRHLTPCHRDADGTVLQWGTVRDRLHEYTELLKLLKEHVLLTSTEARMADLYGAGFLKQVDVALRRMRRPSWRSTASGAIARSRSTARLC
jgi:hypothetical protein